VLTSRAPVASSSRSHSSRREIATCNDDCLARLGLHRHPHAGANSWRARTTVRRWLARQPALAAHLRPAPRRPPARRSPNALSVARPLAPPAEQRLSRNRKNPARRREVVPQQPPPASSPPSQPFDPQASFAAIQRAIERLDKAEAAAVQPNARVVEAIPLRLRRHHPRTLRLSARSAHFSFPHPLRPAVRREMGTTAKQASTLLHRRFFFFFCSRLR
jgi:hypothetical protein